MHKASAMTGCVRKFDRNMTMSFKISDKQLPKKYNQILKRVQKLLKMEFNSKPVYGIMINTLKQKQKYMLVVLLQIFRAKKMPKEKAPYKCLSTIMLDSVIKGKRKYCVKHFWKNANMNKKR